MYKLSRKQDSIFKITKAKRLSEKLPANAWTHAGPETGG